MNPTNNKKLWRQVQEIYDPSIDGEVCLFCGKKAIIAQAVFKTWVHTCDEHEDLIKYVGFAAELEAFEYQKLLDQEYQLCEPNQ